MPAIQLERLIHQITLFLDPELEDREFIHNLTELMEAHANLTYKPGIEVQVNNTILSYQLGPLVSYHIRIKFIQISNTHPEKALRIADQIWNSEYIEMKQLAAVLIGSIPVDRFTETSERIEQWFNTSTDKAVRKSLFDSGTTRVRKENQTLWLNTIRSWLESGEESQILTGMNALEILASDKSFDNYPFIFGITNTLIETKKDKITNSLTKIYQNMIKKSPNEIAYFLQHTLLSAPTESKNRFIRKCLPYFPAIHQKKLREMLNR